MNHLTMEPANLSFFAIPVYWVLTLIPHSYAVYIMQKANNGRWDNSSPRSTQMDAKYRQSTPAETYSRYERAKAAEKNGFENMPLFIGAILAGNIAQLETRTLNLFVTVYLFSRVLYTVCYVNIGSHKLSFARSTAWFFGAALCMGVYVKVGLALS